MIAREKLPRVRTSALTCVYTAAREIPDSSSLVFFFFVLASSLGCASFLRCEIKRGIFTQLCARCVYTHNRDIIQSCIREKGRKICRCSYSPRSRYVAAAVVSKVSSGRLLPACWCGRASSSAAPASAITHKKRVTN